MQTHNRGPKQPILIPYPSFMIANNQGFPKSNQALVNYHFCFSGCSTQFPCEILQHTLIRVEILKKKATPAQLKYFHKVTNTAIIKGF